jgi:small subunit ribosomal protein S6
MFILKPDIPEEESERIISQMESVVTSTGGTLRKTDRMGRRRLAYFVRRYREGQYVLLDVECEVPTVQEVERRLKVVEPVLKFQSVRTDEELKRATKLQAARSKHSARRKPKAGAEPAAAPA